MYFHYTYTFRKEEDEGERHERGTSIERRR